MKRVAQALVVTVVALAATVPPARALVGFVVAGVAAALLLSRVDA